MMSTKHKKLPTLDKGFIFRGRRVQLGLTLDGLRRRSGVGVNSIRRLELGGRVALRTVLRLAPHLELTEQQALEMLVIAERQALERKKRQQDPSEGVR